MMKNKKIIIAGGTGFIGQNLVKYFGKENDIVILCRTKTSNHQHPKKLHTTNDGLNVRYENWDGKTIDDSWCREIDFSDIVINLAGKSVNCRYHTNQKSEIIGSRINSTKAIGESVRIATRPPKVWINASSATVYRNSYDASNNESTGIISELKKDNMPYNFIDQLRYKKNRILTRLFHGKNSDAYKELDLDFSVQVCNLWEKTFFAQHTPHTRKIVLRAAISLGDGGVMVPYRNLCRFGLGGKHGHGRQMFSWVHIDDVARMIEWLFDNESAQGVYNCVAPNVVSNFTFMETLRNVMGRRFGMPANTFFLELGAFLIGTETELLLKSRWVVAGRAVEEGFDFKYKTLTSALENIISDHKT